MVMTLLWWGRYAGTSETEPVLPQSFSATDVAKIQGHLRSIGITTKVDGDRVLVPADRRDEALAALALADVMPDNTASGFDEMSKQLSPWDSQSKQDAVYKEGKQRTLQNVIRKMDGVRDAVVLIEPATGRDLSRKLKIPAYTTAKLFQPTLNLQFGTYYLRVVTDQLGGHTEAALAAYNAGMSRAKSWLTWGDFKEPAEFVETVPFTQTRGYIQAVLRNADAYRRIYGPQAQ